MAATKPNNVKKRKGQNSARKGKKSVGISTSGKSAEDLFENVTGYARTKKRAEGDFKHLDVAIEVKKVTASKKTGNGTINQVRASKGGLLVIYVANLKEWIVLDSKAVLKLVATLKNRGQHNENPFECCNLSIKNLDQAGYVRFSNSEMKQEVARAISRTKKDKKTARLCARILADSQRLAADHRRLVCEELKVASKN